MGTMAILSLCKGVKRAEESLTKLLGEVREKWGWKNGVMDWMEEFQLKLSISRSFFVKLCWNSVLLAEIHQYLCPDQTKEAQSCTPPVCSTDILMYQENTWFSPLRPQIY